MNQQVVRTWGPYDSALWQTCAALTAVRSGRTADLPAVAVPFALGPAGADEQIIGVGELTVWDWRPRGDGSYQESTGFFVATGFAGLAVTATVVGVQVTQNAARRRQAQELARPDWLPIDRGMVFVGRHGLHVQSPARFYSCGWEYIRFAQVVGMGRVWIQGESQLGPFSWMLESHWSEMVFVLWALARHPAHPQLTGGSWLPAGWAEWASRQGFGPVPLTGADRDRISSPADRRPAPTLAGQRAGAGARTSPTVPEAVDIHASVKSAYAAYECNYQSVLSRPALSDVTEPATAHFIETFAEANALEPSDVRRCPPDHATRYIDAVLRAEGAWEAADANSREVALSRMDVDQRNRVRQARLALDAALHPGTPASQRLTAITKAQQLLAGLIMLPRPVTDQLRRAVATATDQAQIEDARRAG